MALALALALTLTLTLTGCIDTSVVPRLYGDRYEKCSSGEAMSLFEDAERLLAKGQNARAVPLLRRAAELCPEHVLYQVRYMDAANALPGETVAGHFVPHVETRAMRQKYLAIPDAGDSPLPPYFRARLQRMAGRAAPADELLQTALDRDAQFYFAHYERGLIWRGIGRSHKAVRHLRRALDTRPGFLDARRELADAYDELWEWRRAADNYRVYLSARPNDRRAQRAFLTLIVYRVEAESGEALTLVRALLAQSPGDLSLQMDLAAIHWKRGETALAADGYRQVLAKDHTRARAALNLGNLHYDLGRRATGPDRKAALTKARFAYRYFRSLDRFHDAYDWFDLNFAARARLRQIDLELGAREKRTITWKDL